MGYVAKLSSCPGLVFITALHTLGVDGCEMRFPHPPHRANVRDPFPPVAAAGVSAAAPADVAWPLVGSVPAPGELTAGEVCRTDDETSTLNKHSMFACPSPSTPSIVWHICETCMPTGKPQTTRHSAVGSATGLKQC